MASRQTRPTRQKKPSKKAQESSDVWVSKKTIKKWCKVYLDADNKILTVNTNSLELDDCDVLSESDLWKGNLLIWKDKGKRYQWRMQDAKKGGS